ncbi:MAG: flagellar FlaF family protein [Rhodospirillales bacterium]|nr:flagellar FlaF family protein [Rhodospirillales bacterium]
MTMRSTAGYGAYSQVQNRTEDSRSVEYRLLAQVTAAMLAANDRAGEFPKLVDAVLWNRSVWAAFRDDLSHPQNGLPDDLKARLISLSLWVDRESHAVLGKTSDIEALVDVNRNIMEGLAASSRGTTAGTTQAAPISDPVPVQQFGSTSA